MTKSSKAIKAKPVTGSLPTDLLAVVDDFVEQHKNEGISRSSVVEEAVRLWLQATRDRADYEYYMRNAQSLKAENDSWSAVSAEAAKEVFK